MIRVHIGNPRGRIALWLDENEAIDLAEHYGRRDGAYAELIAAVERAYPEASEDDLRPGLRISVSRPSGNEEA